MGSDNNQIYYRGPHIIIVFDVYLEMLYYVHNIETKIESYT